MLPIKYFSPTPKDTETSFNIELGKPKIATITICQSQLANRGLCFKNFFLSKSLLIGNRRNPIFPCSGLGKETFPFCFVLSLRVQDSPPLNFQKKNTAWQGSVRQHKIGCCRLQKLIHQCNWHLICQKISWGPPSKRHIITLQDSLSLKE